MDQTPPTAKPEEKTTRSAESNGKSAIRFHVKAASRGKLIEIIKSAKNLPAIDQDYILAKIALIPAEQDILQFSLFCVPHKAGFNFNFTVCEV